jgi:hypothetical protein
VLCYILLYKRLNIQPNNVRGVMSCFGCVCLPVYGGVQHILCCVFLCMVVSNAYSVVFLFCFSSFYVRYVSSFSGLFIFDCTFSIL